MGTSLIGNLCPKKQWIPD